MYCYYQKTVLIPEWQVGDVIAQRTERQGTMPFDFINLSLPQFSMPSIREIRVASHVNYELRSDFISEFARSAVRPINEFQTDLARSIPRTTLPDVVVPSVKVDIKPTSYLTPTSSDSLLERIAQMVERIDREKDIFLEVSDFAQYFLTQLDDPLLSTQRSTLMR